MTNTFSETDAGVGAGDALRTKASRIDGWRLAVGAIFIVTGLAAMTVLFAVVYGQGALLENLAFQLGLPWVILLSGLAQSIELIGAWLAWSAFQRSDVRSPR